VLVDGDDMDEPVGDAARGILDGHVVLSRKLAQAGHFPAIDVLQSISRVMDRVTTPEARATADEARGLLAAYREVEDLVRVGAYERGQDPTADRALDAQGALTDFLRQRVGDAPDPTPALTLRRVLDGAMA